MMKPCKIVFVTLACLLFLVGCNESSATKGKSENEEPKEVEVEEENITDETDSENTKGTEADVVDKKKDEKVHKEQSKEETNSHQKETNKNQTHTETNAVQGETTVYENPDYHFTLSIPTSWEGHYTVEEGHWNKSADVSYDFSYTYKGEIIGTLFSIHIINGELDEEAPLTVIATHNEKTYAYTKALEIPEAFYERKDLKDAEASFLKMVNEDIPQIVQSLSFP